jgi:hypothetical protein
MDWRVERPRLTLRDRWAPRLTVGRHRYRVLVCPVRVLAREWSPLQEGSYQHFYGVIRVGG